MGTWTTELEISAIEEYLDIAIDIDTAAAAGHLVHKRSGDPDKKSRVQLILVGEESKENHYHVVVDPAFIRVKQVQKERTRKTRASQHHAAPTPTPVEEGEGVLRSTDSPEPGTPPASRSDTPHKPSIEQLEVLMINYFEKGKGSDPALQQAMSISREVFYRESPLAAALKSQSSGYGFKIQDGESDGNCFFHAIADQLTERGYPVRDHAALRKIAAAYMHENWEEFKPVIEALVLSPADYLANLAKNDQEGTWADDPIICALAKALNMTFIIVKSDGARPNLIAGGEGTPKLYVGYYVNLHYVSLRGEPNAEMTAVLPENRERPRTAGVFLPSALQSAEYGAIPHLGAKVEERVL